MNVWQSEVDQLPASFLKIFKVTEFFISLGTIDQVLASFWCLLGWSQIDRRFNAIFFYAKSFTNKIVFLRKSNLFSVILNFGTCC